MSAQTKMETGIQIVISAPLLDKIVSLHVEAGETIENLKALVQVETGILLADQSLQLNGTELQNNKTITECGIKSNDILTVYSRSQSSGAQPPQQQESGPLITWPPKQIQEWYRSHPQELQQLLQSNPTLAEAVLSEDTTLLSNLMAQEQQKRRQAEMQRMMELSMYEADPLNPDLQKKIEEDISWTNINENMENALEYNPESFGRVVMLYIDVEVNGTPVKAFVDSGAQSTIMSVECAQRCNIMRLVDKRWAGIARGVGTAQIIGRVHGAHIKIGKSFFNSSFTVLAGNQGTELLIGLDMLKHHQCIIDLKESVLRIANEVVPFLAEKDIPMHVRLDQPAEDFPESPVPNRSTTTTTPPATSTTATRTLPPSNSAPRPTTATTNPPATRPTSQPSTTSSTNSSNPLAALLPNLLSSVQTPATSSSTPTPSTAQQPATGARVPAPSGGRRWPEESVQRLMELGYSRQECETALVRCNGNVDFAASYLFSQGGGF